MPKSASRKRYNMTSPELFDPGLVVCTVVDFA
jgi:hypothetical protein